jgi:hypothetical protein
VLVSFGVVLSYIGRCLVTGQPSVLGVLPYFEKQGFETLTTQVA